MRIDIGDYHLSPVNEGDTDALVSCMKDKEIYDNTITIPYPFKSTDVNAFFIKAREREYSFAIRLKDGRMIGHIEGRKMNDRTIMIAYWLSKPYWNKGIMSVAVWALTDHIFKTPGIVRITANCFEHNYGSARVLEKAGFFLEGKFEKHYCKDGKFLNAKCYAKVI